MEPYVGRELSKQYEESRELGKLSAQEFEAVATAFKIKVRLSQSNPVLYLPFWFNSENVTLN